LVLLDIVWVELSFLENSEKQEKQEKQEKTKQTGGMIFSSVFLVFICFTKNI
jgi:hypothetical protein